jgi:hypothetical protein
MKPVDKFLWFLCERRLAQYLHQDEVGRMREETEEDFVSMTPFFFFFFFPFLSPLRLTILAYYFFFPL